MSNEDTEYSRIMTFHRLWWIGNIAFGIIDLLSNAIEIQKVAELHKNFKSIMCDLGTKNTELKELLKKHPRFNKINV